MRFIRGLFDLDNLPFALGIHVGFYSFGMDGSDGASDGRLLHRPALVGGGMPEVVLAPEEKKILRQYYDTVVSKDTAERFRVRNDEALRALLFLYYS